MNTNYLIKANMLTPVHVGAGQEKKLNQYLDFFYKDRKIVLVDTSKIYHSLSEKERLVFVNHLSDSRLPEFGSYLIDTCKLNIDDFKIGEIDCPGSKPMQEVFPLISTAGANGRSVYLPGSSVKGAIRSVLYAYLYHQGKGANEKDIFGTIDRNLMSLIQVSDAPFKTSRIINCKIFNLFNDAGRWTAGWKHEKRKTNETFSTTGFVTSYEVFGLNESTNFTIKLNKERIEYLKLSQHNIQGKSPLPPNYQIIEKLDVPGLFEIINWHTRMYLNAELDFFKNYNNQEPYSETIIAFIEDLITKVPDNNRNCILHLGCGSGFHGITGDWKYARDHTDTGYDKNEKIKYKSRKMAFRKIQGNPDFDIMPMGFMKLTVTI